MNTYYAIVTLLYLPNGHTADSVVPYKAPAEYTQIQMLREALVEAEKVFPQTRNSPEIVGIKLSA